MLDRVTKVEDITYCMLLNMKNEDTVKNQFILEDITKQENISVAYLRELSNHKHQQILLNVANHKNTTEDILLSMYGINQYKWVNDVVLQRVGLEKLQQYLNKEVK